MSALVFTLREVPPQRLDLSPLAPERLTGRSDNEVAAIELQTTRERVNAGDVFSITPGDAATVVFEGGSERFDRVGFGMSGGAIRVEGEVGVQAGRLMRGGTLTIAGNTGPWAASGMVGGLIEITGDAGERLGGPLAGEVTGMRGGVVVVRGRAGARAADRLRRGMILVEGDVGDDAGSRMVAGTLLVGGRAARRPGYLLGRGTLVFLDGAGDMLPTFADCGVHEFVANSLMASFVAPYSSKLASAMRRPWRRFAGDMAVSGKGEILLPPA